MQNRVYVGNLAPQINETALRQFFSTFGTVSDVEVVYDHETSQSKGFGYVTFAEAQDAERALDANGESLETLTIRVSLAQARQPA